MSVCRFAFVGLILGFNIIGGCFDCIDKDPGMNLSTNLSVDSGANSSEKNHKIYDGKLYVYCSDNSLKCRIESIYREKIAEINKKRNITSNEAIEIYYNYVKPIIVEEYVMAGELVVFNLLDGKDDEEISEENKDKPICYPYEIYCVPRPQEFGIDVAWYNKNMKGVSNSKGLEALRNKCNKPIKNDDASGIMNDISDESAADMDQVLKLFIEQFEKR